MKNTYKNPTDNILGGERLNVFLLSMGTRQRLSYLLSPVLFNRVLEVLVRPVRQDKEIGRHADQREDKTIPICR